MGLASTFKSARNTIKKTFGEFMTNNVQIKTKIVNPMTGVETETVIGSFDCYISTNLNSKEIDNFASRQITEQEKYKIIIMNPENISSDLLDDGRVININNKDYQIKWTENTTEQETILTNAYCVGL